MAACFAFEGKPSPTHEKFTSETSRGTPERLTKGI